MGESEVKIEGVNEFLNPWSSTYLVPMPMPMALRLPLPCFPLSLGL